MRRVLFLIAALAGAFALAALAARPPSPLLSNAPPGLFSAGRAFADIGRIARAPHPTGSAEDAEVRAYLVQRLRALGLGVELQAAPLSATGRLRLARWVPGGAAGAQAVNVIGLLPGRDRAAPAVLLMAHHDTVANSPGAADDSTGVAAILETVRALGAGGTPARDLIVLFTDAEELHSDGAAAFFRNHPLSRRVGVVVNLETRGGGGRALMFETGPANGPMMRLFARAVRTPSANSIAVLVYRLMPNFTDFSIPKAAGTAGFNFAFLGRPGLYHSPRATPAAIDPASVQHIGDQVLDLTRSLLGAPSLPPPGPDAVFCDLFGLGLVIYPAWAGWVLLAAAAVLLVVAGARARAAGMLSLGGVGRDAGVGLVAVLVAGGLLQLANMASGAGPHDNYYDRLAAIPRLELQAALICLAVLCLAAAGRRDEARVRSSWLGLAGLVLVMAGVVQALAADAGPALTWPLLAGAALAAVTDPRDLAVSRRAGVLAAAIAAAGAAYVLGLAHFAFLGVGADAPAAMAIVLLLVLLLVWPFLRGALSVPAAACLAAALMITALGVAAWVRFDAPAPPIPAHARGAA